MDNADIELTSVLLDSAQKRKVESVFADSEVRTFSTSGGDFRVTVKGDANKPIIVTLPEMGLGSSICFDTFFSLTEVQPFLKLFRVYHIEFPGQWEGAKDLPENFLYPTLDDLTRHFSSVLEMLAIKCFHGFGVGLGANILVRFATLQPRALLSLTLINGFVSQCGWLEWGRMKYHIWQLQSGLMPESTMNEFLWQWLGDWTCEVNHDLQQMFVEQLSSPGLLNRKNLAKMLISYRQRSDVSTNAPVPLNKINCQTLLICGDFGSNLEEVTELNSRLDPSRTQFVKMSDTGGMPLLESPAKVAEAFVLFFQGMGYAPNLKAIRGASGISAAAAAAAAARSEQVEKKILEHAEDPEMYTSHNIRGRQALTEYHDEVEFSG